MPTPSPPILSITNPTHLTQTSTTHSLPVPTILALHRAALAAKAAAYCPYSNFRVGAALLLAHASPSTGDEHVVTGANIENASYPVGTCAERVALGRAVMEGHREFRAIGVAADTKEPCSPCGMCRQFIREFCDLSLPVLMFAKDGDYVVLTLQELLPMSFGSDALKAMQEATTTDS